VQDGQDLFSVIASLAMETLQFACFDHGDGEGHRSIVLISRLDGLKIEGLQHLRMKRMKTKNRRSAAKPRVAPKSVDDYLARVPDPARSHFGKIRAVIRSVVPDEATETISYGIPAFRHKKVLVWFAAFSEHCSLFPTASVIEKFKNELKDFSTSKGTIHFPLDKPVPTALIKKIVKARVAQSAGEGKE
jgi:uncharacterized protein YdhG (YjbR/CyaY superfamily)